MSNKNPLALRLHTYRALLKAEEEFEGVYFTLNGVEVKPTSLTPTGARVNRKIVPYELFELHLENGAPFEFSIPLTL
jgi:hypothetical protein